MLRRLIGEDIELVTARTRTSDRSAADPGQIAAGADEPRRQRARRDARRRHARDPRRATSTLDDEYGAQHRRAPGAYVLLACRDTGVGMDAGDAGAHLRAVLHDEGASARAPASASRPATASSSRAAGTSGSRARPGEGSSFHSYLPALPAAARAGDDDGHEAPRVLSQPPQGAGRRILVVEDEAVVRTLLARTLERLGYAVETAEDPSVALPMLRARGDEFALVISDMMMPHTTGAEFAREVATWMPELPFIFISGYTEDVGRAGRRRRHRVVPAEALHFSGARGRGARRSCSGGRHARDLRVLLVRCSAASAGERRVQRADHESAIPDRRCHPLGRAAAHITDGEDVRPRALQEQRLPSLPFDAGQSSGAPRGVARHDETLLVEADQVDDVLGPGEGPDHREHGSGGQSTLAVFAGDRDRFDLVATVQSRTSQPSQISTFSAASMRSMR